MIALDTSSILAFLADEDAQDVDAIDIAMRNRQAVLPPPVVAELLSGIGTQRHVAKIILSLPRLTILDEFWERAGELRAKIRGRGLKAKFADVLIAQVCLDHEVALITRDRDFRHFARYAGLRLQ